MQEFQQANYIFSFSFLFSTHRKHALFAKCFFRTSAAFCHTSESTSTSLLTSARSVVPAADLSTSSHMSPKTACITLAELATGISLLLKDKQQFLKLYN